MDPREDIKQLDRILKATRFAKRHRVPLMTDIQYQKIIKRFLSVKKRFEKLARQMEKDGCFD